MNREKKDKEPESKGICRKCGKNEAKIHHVIVENNEVFEWHLCHECAVGEGFGLDELDLGSAKGENGAAQGTDPVCGVCGMTLTDLRRTKLIGCAACYGTFSDLLTKLLEKYHGSSAHKGHPPVFTTGNGLPARAPEVDLHEELKAAVKNEDFERAAELRDRIRDKEEDGEDAR